MSFKVILLSGVFIVAIVIRLMFYPNNVYFGYDQARDSYGALEFLKGNLKVIGPPSSLNEKIFHGPLIYYVYAPIYFLFNLNPEAVAFIFRVINALGIIIVFAIGLTLFNKEVGFISALIFAISYEQSQYSLFLSHPALAVLTTLLYYLGLSLLIFKNKPKGLVLMSIGLGLSIQFHYVNLFLVLGLLGYYLFFHKRFSRIETKWILLSLVSFLIIISTFIIAEFKFNFRTTQSLVAAGSSFLTNPEGKNSLLSSVKLVGFRFFHDNFIFYPSLIFPTILLFILVICLLLHRKTLRGKVVFLLIWGFNGLIPYLTSGTTSYYHSPSASVSLIITTAFLIYLVSKKNLLIGAALITFIIISNLHLILTQNMKGPNSDIVIQPGMLTFNEKKVLDYCYAKSGGENFAVNALSVPLYINTTWSYLFEWYGFQKYGYLPIWGGKNAAGFPGNIKVVDKRSELPEIQCLIIEPTVGIEDHDKRNFIAEEDYFSTVLEERQFGTLIVQLRRKI